MKLSVQDGVLFCYPKNEHKEHMRISHVRNVCIKLSV